MITLIHSNAASSQAAAAGETVSPPSVSPATNLKSVAVGGGSFASLAAREADESAASIPHDERSGCWPIIALTAAFWIGVYLAWSFIW